MGLKVPSFVKFLGLMVIFTSVPLTLHLLYNRTGGPTSQKEMLLYKNLRYVFMKGTATVDLAPLTPWPWVKVCAVTHGLSQEQLAGIIGFAYKDYGELHWMPRPEYWTLLFIDSTREASWGTATPVVPVRIPRKELADFTLPEGSLGTCVERQTGGLVLSRKTDAPVGTTPVTVSLGLRTP